MTAADTMAAMTMTKTIDMSGTFLELGGDPRLVPIGPVDKLQFHGEIGVQSRGGRSPRRTRPRLPDARARAARIRVARGDPHRAARRRQRAAADAAIRRAARRLPRGGRRGVP